VHGFGEQVAFVVVARLPGAAVRVADLGHQGGQVVILVGDLAAQRVDFFEQAGVFVVIECRAVTICLHTPDYRMPNWCALTDRR